MSRTTKPGRRMGGGWVDQAHPDPSLGRLRPRSVPRATITPRADRAVPWDPDPLHVPTEPVNPEPPRWMRRIDVGLAIAVAFFAALWFGRNVIASAICGA